MVNLNKTTVNLTKNQGVNLSKEYDGLNSIHIGLGWDPAKQHPQKQKSSGFLSTLFGLSSSSSSSADIDLDGWAALYGENGENKGLVYYGNRYYKDRVVYHHGDNLTGDGEGDDEVITIKLKEVPNDVKYVIVGITIYCGKLKNQKFGDIENTFIRLVDERNGFEICRYVGNDIDPNARTFFAGMFIRENGEWQFRAIGESETFDNISSARKNGAKYCR